MSIATTTTNTLPFVLVVMVENDDCGYSDGPDYPEAISFHRTQQEAEMAYCFERRRNPTGWFNIMRSEDL
jgi:hypothetical protein